MPKQLSTQPGEHPPDDPPGALDQHRVRAMRTLLLAAGVAVPAIALAIFLRDGITLLTLLAIACCALVWLLGFLLHRGRVVLAAHGLVLTVLVASTATSTITGGVRSAGVFVMVASIALAGTFLSRAKMIAVVLYTIVALGVINWLEQQGMLPGTLPPTGWTVWVIQTAVIAMLLVSALAGQYRLQEAFEKQEDALTLAHESASALRATEERFKSLFRNNPAACMVQSLETRLLVDANEAYSTMYGCSRSELLGQHPPNLWADLNEHQTFRDTLKAHGRVQGMHARGLRRDGSTFDSLVYAEIIQQGNERLMIGMVLDISAEETARKALQRSEERFSKAFHFSPLTMAISRLSDGTYLEVSAAQGGRQGYGADELKGKTALQTGFWLSQQDREAFVARLRREGSVHGFETRMRNKDGSISDMRVWADTVDLDGEACVLSCMLDISEEKRREAQLMDIARGVSGHNSETFFTEFTRHMAQALKADLVIIGEQISGQRIQTLAVHFDGAPADNFVYPLEGTPCGTVVGKANLCVFPSGLSALFPNDEPLVAMGLQAYVGQRFLDADGSPIGLINAAWKQPLVKATESESLMSIFASRANAELLRLMRERDIRSLNTTLDQRVRARTAELHKLNAELDSFAYSVSHDLRSPLRAIDGYAHLLREQLSERLDPDEQQLFERVLASTSRMSAMIADMLALARINQSTLKREDTDLSAMANAIMALELEKQPGRTVELRIGAGLRASCDPSLTRIALENLLSNAFKYTQHQPVARIEFGQVKGTGATQGEFFVRDNGAGFDMAYSDKLFKPFQRLHMPTEFEGSGIGLATVRRIVERHGGQIRGEAAPGQGATFSFSFGGEFA